MSSAVVTGPPVTTVLVGQPPALMCAAHALARRGIELLATVAPQDAVRLVSLHRPQVVVVNLDGGQAALTVIATVTATVQQIPVLTLTAVPDHATVLAAVQAGAVSHLVAPGNADELADAVRCTAAGQAVFSPGLADVVLEQFGRPVDPQEGARRLTQREADVLRLVVDGLTARQIAARLVLSPRTVENHVQNVLRKLGVRSRAALVRYAIENGLA
jgi:DNA-binding NarL/FixJ family response regulator